jgi:flagellar M-ring protein FliF|tara:strand:- start:570 stop:2186 length:1617 start_codon:yes stop_codon:yes gene_type:complete
VGAFLQIVKGLGTARLAVIGIMLATMAFFFIFMVSRLTGANMELLYSDLSDTDQRAIIAQLSSRKIPYEVKGNQLFVPAEQVGTLRMSMAAEGLPLGSVVGYEIFDSGNGLGTTNFMQNVQLVRALEGELAKTIRSIESIKNARVHLVMPRRKLFTRDQQNATASVILKMRGAASLTSEQIAAIQHLVAAAIPELDPARVSVVDNKGKLLASGNDTDSEVARANDLVSRRVNFENRMSNALTGLLEKSVGIGNVKVNVNADLDFDRMSTTEEKFDPDGQVLRSSNTVEESSTSEESEGQQPVGVQQNLPDAQDGAEGGATSKNAETRTEEVTNFEISKKVINHVKESGIIKRISVAVLIDGEWAAESNGKRVYRKRSNEEMENLAKLVSSAIGYNADRGDTVEVINMRFVEEDADFDEPLDLFFGLEKKDIVDFAEMFVLLILAVLAILLVVKPLLTRAFEVIPAVAAEAEQRLLEEAASVTAIAAPDEDAEEFEELIDIDRVEGRVKASSVKKVGEIVEKHPEEALSIIRNWMYQEG